MEFIRKKIDRKIQFLENSESLSNLKIYYQVRIEYLLIYCLGYLWNKNLSLLSQDQKDYVLSKIQKPTIGDVEEILRKLDVNSEFYLNRNLNVITKKYPRLRNEKIGHGYVFEDGTSDFLHSLKEIYLEIEKAKIPFLADALDLVQVKKIENRFYKGILYKPDGSEYRPWSCSVQAANLLVDNIYLLDSKNEYCRLSPFIEIRGEDEFYVFSSVQEPLLGRVKYNKLISTGTYHREWSDFIEAEITSNGSKRKSINGTILNIFKHNYTKYIDIGIKSKVTDFLTKTSHSVSATIWGHGGVGKTATIQNVCEELSQASKKKFDYIIFLSAKDRFFNYHTGKIQDLGDSVSTFDEIVRSINQLIFDTTNAETEDIERFDGKMLIIIDDYETFSAEEKSKVVSFIRKLNPNYHRLLVTTRADLKIGDEIQSNELSQAQTKEFFLKVLENEFQTVPIKSFQEKIAEPENIKKLYAITNGRPLFIFQFAHTLVQKGNVDEALKFDIKQTPEAIDFLYGRIYNYLSKSAQDLFVAISLLVSESDLSNLTEKLKYVLNWENDEDRFQSSLQELEKLRIVEVKENDFFTVYSKEILQKMHDYFLKKDEAFRRLAKQRLLQVTKDKKLDNEQALLQNADSNRVTKNEEEVVSSYRFILNRTSAPYEVKLQAILNLSSYLFIDRGKKESAVKTLDEYQHLFKDDGKFVKMNSTYLWSLGSIGQKEKALKVLLDYAVKHNNLKSDINLELMGLLITYKSIYEITRKEILKEALKYGEIGQSEFSAENRKVKDEFNNIYRYYGHLYYDFLRKCDITKIGSGSRQNAATGLYQFSEVLVRIGKFEKATELCEFVIQNFPQNFHPIFRSKLKKINDFKHQREFYGKKMG